jgi:hypothetical protein
MIDRLVIYLLLAGCLILGAVVLLELAPAATDTAAPKEISRNADTTSAVHRQLSTRLDELLAVALARPLFSSTRRPPQAATNDSATGSDLDNMRLTGIVTEPDHHIAIFAVNGAKPLRLTEGEAVSGWRIESITPHEVSLSGPSGTKTLEPKLDPNLVQAPPGPTPAANPGNPGVREPAAQQANVPRRSRVAPGVPAAAAPPRQRASPSPNPAAVTQGSGLSPATGRPLRPLPRPQP